MQLFPDTMVCRFDFDRCTGRLLSGAKHHEEMGLQ